MEPLSPDGLHATYRGRRYSANHDTDGNLVLTTSDPESESLGFVDRHGAGTYTKVAEPLEVTSLERTRHVGTFRGAPVEMSVNARGRVLVGTADESVAAQLGLTRVDKAWWEAEVAPQDPELSITEIREPVDDVHAPEPDVDRYFARYDANRVLIALLRRHFTPQGHEDQVLRDVGEWQPDRHGSVARAILYAIDSDLESVTSNQAAQFQRMVAERRYRPF